MRKNQRLLTESNKKEDNAKESEGKCKNNGVKWKMETEERERLKQTLEDETKKKGYKVKERQEEEES